MRKSKEETAATIHKLMGIARIHFTEHGYAGAALESIVQEANLTRGAVYHHFRSKKELFREVLEDVQREVAEKVEEAAAESDELWQQLALGCRGFLMAAVEPRNKRIMLVDGPAILGWDVWREMDKKHSMRLLRGQLGMMQEEGCFRDVSLDAMTHLLSGALNELALWLAHESPASDALDDALKALQTLLHGFRHGAHSSS